MEINNVTIELEDVKAFIENADIDNMFVLKYDREQNVKRKFNIENTNIDIECVFSLNITTDVDDEGNDVVFSFEFDIDFYPSCVFFEIDHTEISSELRCYIEEIGKELERKYLYK